MWESEFVVRLVRLLLGVIRLHETLRPHKKRASEDGRNVKRAPWANFYPTFYFVETGAFSLEKLPYG